MKWAWIVMFHPQNIKKHREGVNMIWNMENDDRLNLERYESTEKKNTSGCCNFFFGGGEVCRNFQIR